MGIISYIAGVLAMNVHGAADVVECDGGLLGEWVFTTPLAAVFVLLFALCIFVTKWRKAIFSHLKLIAATVFAAGIVLYFIGFNWEGSQGNVLALLMRATVSSIEMFVSETDLLEVEHSLKYDHLYMTFFALTHFSAVFVSAIVILRVFGLRLLSMLRLLAKFRKGGKLYVFWDVNENSITVAESIMLRPGDLIVFVKVPYSHHEHHSSRFTFSHFFHIGDDGIEQYVNRIEALGAIVLSAKDKPKDGDFFKQLKLARLGKVLSLYATVEFFFLSDGEHNNVASLSALKKFAATPRGKELLPDAITVYCHARRSHFSNNLLGCPGLEHKAHLIDSSMLAALQLKEDGRSHPVNFVDVDATTATVLSVFTALVVGFGETGSDVFKFLYEFSSFIKGVKTGSDGLDDVEEQSRRIYVADGELARLKTKFLETAPALSGSQSIEWLDGMTTHAQDFWNKLKEIIDELSYVVVAVDNDDEALSAAIGIFDFAYRYRRNMDRFKIYVRLRADDGKSMLDGIDRYTIGGRRIIEVFGTCKEIFSYSNISAVSAEADAKDFFYQYSIATVGIDGTMTAEAKRKEIEKIKELQPGGLWKSRRDSNADGGIEGAVKVDYQEEQDRSNVSHVYTKLALAGVCDRQGNICPDRLREIVASLDTGSIDARLIANLDYCEHCRWNSKMELLGFVHGATKDFKRKTHPCMVSCNELIRNSNTRGTVIYDQGTVELSFRKALQTVGKNK